MAMEKVAALSWMDSAAWTIGQETAVQQNMCCRTTMISAQSVIKELEFSEIFMEFVEFLEVPGTPMDFLS